MTLSKTSGVVCDCYICNFYKSAVILSKWGIVTDTWTNFIEGFQIYKKCLIVIACLQQAKDFLKTWRVSTLLRKMSQSMLKFYILFIFFMFIKTHQRVDECKGDKSVLGNGLSWKYKRY